MSELPTFENVLLDRLGQNDRIGRITLNRPEKMNALSQELIYDFATRSNTSKPTTMSAR